MNQSNKQAKSCFLNSSSDDLLKIKVEPGVSFIYSPKCKHINSLSSSSSCACTYCNFLFKLDRFYKNNSVCLTKSNIKQLIGKDFLNIFHSSCLLFLSVKTGTSSYPINHAKSLTDHKLGNQYDCPISGMHGLDLEKPYCYDSWGVCNHAEHLFECLSTRDETRGKHFPVSGQSYNWNATCTACGASCAYSSPREGLILSIFFHFFDVLYNGKKYYLRIRGTDEKVHCSREIGELVVLIQGGCVTWRNIEITNTQPRPVLLYSSVTLLESIQENINYAGVFSRRFAKDHNVISSADCGHDFYLSSSDGFQLKLTTNMLRLLLMLMPSNGYLNGVGVQGNEEVMLPNACGLISCGGLQGVNVRTNIKFNVLHEQFYSGSYRVEHNADDIVSNQERIADAFENGIDIIADVQQEVSIIPEANCAKQSSLGSDDYDDVESEEGDLEAGTLKKLVEDFKHNDDDLLVIPVPTVGRGLGDLAKRVGSLLKGVTNCVTKLHAVWDWPLDTALKGVHDVGSWLEQNNNSVSTKVWSCMMCPEVQEKVTSSLEEQNQMIQLHAEALKKLAVTLDSLARMNKENMESIERKMRELSDKNSRVKMNDASDLESKVEFLIGEVAKLREQVGEKVKGKKKIKPFPTPYASHEVEGVGEQMSIPRNPVNPPQPIRRYGKEDLSDFSFEFQEQAKRGRASVVTAQSGEPIGDVIFKGGEKEKEIVSTSEVKSVGQDETHNAILSNIYLGSVTWSVSSGEGKILRNFSLPEAIWNNNERMRNFASYFQYYTCSGLEFTITTTSVGMQGGTLMVCWDAMSCATKQKIDTVKQLSNLPFEFVSASSSQELKFKVDSPAIQHMMCLSGSEKSVGVLGTFKVCVANVLNAAAETSQSVPVNVWVRFVNPKFSFYTLKHDLVVSQSDGGFSGARGAGSFESIVASGKWSTTSSANLMELTVHPTACSVVGGLVTQTTLSVISHLFNRWSGSLVYRFIFAASMFVRGKLIISAIPVAFRESKLNVSQISSFPHIVVDLSSEEKIFELKVPYNSVGQNSLVCRDSLYDMSSYNAELVVSRVHVLVLDSLVMNANASNSISFCVTLRPGEDFKVFDFSGVKAEFVDRVLPQGMFSSLRCGALVGSSFDKWTNVKSLLYKFKLSATNENALCLMVSPSFRRNPPCITSLSWLSQIFVEWSGSLEYTLRVHSHERNHSSYVRIWYDSNGSTQTGEEIEFLSDVDPPSGAKVFIWDLSNSSEFHFKIPFRARTKKLLINKARYNPSSDDWIKFYNGMIVIDYEGSKEIKVDISISGGDDFEMYEQTVPPRCGRVSKAFTRLSYENKLKGIGDFPLNVGRLPGPINKAVTTPVAFVPVPPVVDEKPTTSARYHAHSDSEDEPKEGDRAIDEEGNDIVYRDGEWDYVEAEKHVGCFDCLGQVEEMNSTYVSLKNADFFGKTVNIVDKVDSMLEENEKTIPKIQESLKFLLPLLKKADKFAGNVEDKMAQFEGVRDKIMRVIKSIFQESIPGIFKAALENEKYIWATLITLIGGVSLVWYCKSKKSFGKKFGILCMIIWSPFLLNKVWDLGKWIKKHIWDYFLQQNNDETCRKHSMADTFEGIKGSFGNFTDWFSNNWVVSTQSLLTVISVITSLVVWGTIPDAQKLTTFSAKFKEIGEKGKTFSNIFSGFSAITKLCSEWSSKFVSWILKSGDDNLPKEDSDLQRMLAFNLRQWVEETRELALAENKFVGFGSMDYINRVRHLYDKSLKVQSALLDGVKVNVQLSLIVKECKDKCVELLNNVYTFKGMKQARIDPIHICMIGAPGVGKSATAHTLINNLLDYMGEPEVDRIYTRCCADAYWSNYHHEPCILYDDLGAVNSKLKMSDFAEIMGIKTNDPFSVPMAAVEDKGKHCTSKYVFSCTNVLELDDSGDVVTKTAYYRRRNVLVEVTRDVTVRRNESNPTEGLQFTVLGYANDGDGRVTFGLKREWNEDFLRDINTEDWVFDRVEFRTFLKFLCTYTTAYIRSQKALLQGIKTYRINPFDGVDDEVEAQAGNHERLMRMEEAIAYFDSMNYNFMDFYKTLREGGVEPPAAWKRNKSATFDELMATMCGCNEERACNFDFVKKRIGDSLGRVDGVPPYECFIVKSVADNPLDTVLLVKKGGTFAEGVHPTVLFCTLCMYYRWSEKTDICPFMSRNRLQKDFVSVAKLQERVSVEFDDRIPLDLEKFEIGDKSVFIWPGVGKFFPSLIKKYGFVSITNGKDVFHFAPRKAVKLNFADGVENTWNTLWVGGFEVKCDVLDLVHADDRVVLRNVARECLEFGSRDNFSDSVNEALALIEEIYGLSFTYFTFILYLLEVRLSVVKAEVREGVAVSKRNKFLKTIGKLDEVERKTVAGLSEKAKIALAIGGGITAAGLLVGLILGLKNLFTTTTDAVTEDAEKEISGGGASSMFQTARIVRGRQKPKIVVSSLEKQVTSAGASANFQTARVVKGRKRPHFLEQQGGFGVTYDDSTLAPDLKREKRRARRKSFISAVKNIDGHKKKSQPTSGDLWQRFLNERGTRVSPNDDTESQVVKRLKRNINAGAEGDMRGEHMIHDGNFETDEDIQEALKKIVGGDKEELQRMIEHGTTVKIEKQAQVGDFGVIKDKNMTELLSTHISKMSCMIISVKNGVYFRCNVLRLTGTFVVMPAHYDEVLGDAEEVWFVGPHKVVKISYDRKMTVLVSEHQDLLVWDLGNSVPPSTNYISHIATSDDWADFSTSGGVLSLTNYNSEMTMQVNNLLDAIELVSADVEVPSGTYEMFGTTHTIIKGLRYRVHCMPGFCGAAVLRANSKCVRKIVGIHVAGATNKGVGYAETLTQEELWKCIEVLRKASNVTKENSFEASTEERVGIDYCEKHSPLISGKGNLGTVGVVEKKELPHLPAKTSIVPSVIHGLIGEVKSEPAILSKWDKRLGEKRGEWDPTIEGVKKYGTPITPFCREEIKIVEDHLSAKFQNMNNSLRKRCVNSIEIGINGIDGTDFWAPMEMKTSPGYPYVLRRPPCSTGKKWLFEEVGSYASGRPKFEMKDEQFVKRFNEIHEEVRRGIVPRILTMECPKDERRKLAKIYDKPATRTFTILPPEINLLFRMYFGDFSAMVMETRASHFSQVGINPETLEWSELMNNFLKVGKKGFAGDYAKFDGIGSPDIYHSIVSIVNAWYNDGETNALVRHCLINSIVHRYGLASDILLRYSQGMPSGFSMTVIFNSFVNYYYMALAWQSIVSKSILAPQADLASFDYYTKIIVYGDDNVVAVDDDFLNVYNLRTVAAYLSSYGITYTDDAKNPIHLSEPYVDITSVSFLKRNFVPVEKTGAVWKAPLDKTSIEERCNWIRECEEPLEALNQNIDSALFEASIHGESYFLDLKSRLDSALERVVLPPTNHSFKVCNSRWWGNMVNYSLSSMDLNTLSDLSKKGSIDIATKYKDVMLGSKVSLFSALDRARVVSPAKFAP